MLRTGLVRAWDASVFVHAEARHGVRERKPMLCLEIRGDLSEPVKKINSFRLTVFAHYQPAAGAAEIPSIGSIISMKGSLEAVVELADREFQLLTEIATAGRLIAVDLSFQEPRYGTGLIASCSFSTREPDDIAARADCEFRCVPGL